MIRAAIWLVALAGVSIAVSYLVTVMSVFGYEDMAEPPRADAIVVLSGNVSRDGKLYGSTAIRVRKGIDLFNAGAAPVIVMSGGGVPKMGDDMAAEAVETGIPPEFILIENRSRSTLQNALFTADLPEITPDMSIVVVTHRYHLLRAWASFRWAGFKQIALVAADPDADYALDHSGIKKEALKWPANILRGGAASLAMGIGLPRDRFEWMLN